MSEAMALEQMAQRLAEMRGYLTATRVPFLGVEDHQGKNKEGTQMGDLDIVGLGAGEKGRLLVIECKGYGGPDSYENWLKPFRLNEIAYLAWAASGNIQKVAHLRWDAEFKLRQYRPDEVWIVFSGAFWLKSNPARWRVGKKYWGPFILELAGEIAGLWKGQKRTDFRELEPKMLEAAEHLLSRDNACKVRLWPVHLLLRQLFLELPVDMRLRRKRYPDTSMEMLRWVHRAVQAGALDLVAIQSEYQTRNYNT